MINYPGWVLDLGDADLVRHFGGDTFERGRRYAVEQRVSSIRRSGALVMAQVRGSGYHSYSTSVTGGSGPDSLVATCTCPVRRDCKHAVALIWHMRTVQSRRLTPSWQQALRPLLTRAASRDGVKLALMLLGQPSNLALRPLRLGARGNWVKTGATWSDVRMPRNEFDQAQRDALVAIHDARQQTLYYYGYRTDAMNLNELGANFWRLLRAAVELDVPLLGETRHAPPLLTDVPFEPVIGVAGADAGLTVTPMVQGNEYLSPLTGLAFVGNPPHGLAAYASDGRLVLGPLGRPLAEAEHRLFAGGSVSVPESDVALFATAFLPQLRHRLTIRVDPGLDLPEAEPPVLQCRVRYGERRADVAWGFRYQVGDQKHELAVSGLADESPVRDPAAEAESAASIPAGPWRGGGSSLREVTLSGRPLIDFVAEVLPGLRDRDDIQVIETGDRPRFTEAEEAPRVELSVTESEAGDWFDLNVTVWVGGEQVPFEALFRALSLDEDHLLLDSGTWFSLDRPELAQLREIVAEARLLVERDRDTFHLRPEHAGWWEELRGLGVVKEQAVDWQRAAEALLSLDELPQVDPPARLRAELRPYQSTGFRWLAMLWRTRLGGILADEMGLGKTLQALALAQWLLEQGELDRPILVVAPTSVLGTWVDEATRFAPDLKVVPVTETRKRRQTALAEHIEGAQIVVTSYTLLRLEADDYAEQRWAAVLSDEAQFVKNHSGQAYKAVRRLKARMKLALTGTPLENNLMDLWSLLSITAPGLFVDPRTFTEVFRKPIEAGDSEALARLHRRIRPLILRRTKSAVADELPDKQEQLVPVELTPAHRRIYDRQLARERQKVLGLVDDLDRNRITILRSLTVLRQLALAPAMVDESWSDQSAKLDVLVERLTDVIAEGHRALVFSQFTRFLALVRKRLTAAGIDHQYLDGRTRNRAERIAEFRTGTDPVFLISLKAGGFGLTLTEADYVFICDPWWNPATEAQAIDRTHRIGQSKSVNVYRLVASDTIEQKVVALQQSKRQLFDQVVGKASDVAAPLTADDIRGLLDV